MSTGSALFYKLDKTDTIIEAGGTWNDMAEQNGAAQLSVSNVLGTRLYDHVSGEATRMFVWTMLDAVRLLKRPVLKSYRCDSPNCRRYMQMIIKPDSGGGLDLEHTVLSVKPLAQTQLFTTAPQSQLSSATRVLVRCSSCNSVRTAGRWQEVETIDTTPFQNSDGAIRVVYGVCERCQESARMPPVSRVNATPRSGN